MLRALCLSIVASLFCMTCPAWATHAEGNAPAAPLSPWSSSDLRSPRRCLPDRSSPVRLKSCPALTSLAMARLRSQRPAPGRSCVEHPQSVLSKSRSPGQGIAPRVPSRCGTRSTPPLPRAASSSSEASAPQSPSHLRQPARSSTSTSSPRPEFAPRACAPNGLRDNPSSPASRTHPGDRPSLPRIVFLRCPFNPPRVVHPPGQCAILIT
jgi:hypothetical protein